MEELQVVIQAWDESGFKKTQLTSPNSAMISKKLLLKIKPYGFFSAQKMQKWLQNLCNLEENVTKAKDAQRK